MSEVSVTDVPGSDRYEARIDGELAGYAEYQKTSRLVVLTHTEVDDAYEGRGVGSALVRGALDAARAQGLPVLPLCPFVKAYIARHPEYADLVYSAPRSTAKD
ncbi:MAG TPA: GNAT family N-acetyltransferase [Actinomycetales bacterium]|nr:GNAT family N-acetyltransferase [Actinomycetales bacterium]